MRVRAVRNRNLSLWQSAVGEVASGFAADRRVGAAMQMAAGLHAAAVDKGTELASPAGSAAAVAASLQASDPQTLAYVSKLAFDVARAHQSGDVRTEAAAVDQLRNFVTRHFGSFDLLGWMQCILRYFEYYTIAHRQPPYVDWAEQTPHNIDFGVIAYRLPKASRILLLGDWGTHMTDNVAMLRQGLRTLRPDVIIHLGDIYYSGTTFECEQNVLKVMNDLVGELGIARPPFFAIPGNHEYYSGGQGFFHMIARLNEGIAGCQQRASYFCLRSEDDAWQFLAMDTGYNDRDPASPTAPGLRTSEVRWHRDKLDRFPGSTVLLSHHQLFSAHDALSDGATPYLNEALNLTFRPYFDRIGAWYWGHEHNFVAFKDGQCGVRKGRLIGCSAYEETQEQDPYEINYPDVAYAPDMQRLALSPYQGGLGKYYNHAMALLEMTPRKIDVSYYQYPSWDDDFTPPRVDEPALMFKETIMPTRAGG
jgi:calcineurin-like phosphoesterase family protein